MEKGKESRYKNVFLNIAEDQKKHFEVTFKKPVRSETDLSSPPLL